MAADKQLGTASGKSSAESFRLDGQVVLVTGAAGHLGRAMTKAIAHAGAVVLAAGRSAEKLQRLSGELSEEGLRVESFQLDVTDVTQIADVVRRIERDFGRLDGIVNNAYSASSASNVDIGVSDFTAAATINMAAPYMLIAASRSLLRAAAKQRRGGASVVNIASMYGAVSPDPRVYKDAAGLASLLLLFL